MSSDPAFIVRIITFTLTCAVWASFSAHAATEDDEAAFRSIVGDYAVESFESDPFPSGSGDLETSYDAGDFVVSSQDGSGNLNTDGLRLINGDDIDDDYSGTHPITGDQWIINTTGSHTLHFDFSGQSRSLDAFGLWITDFGDSTGELRFSNDNGEDVQVMEISSPVSGAEFFWGIYDIAPFTEVSFHADNYVTDGIGIDDVHYSFVPLPPAAGIGFLGMGLVAFVRHRRTRTRA